MEKSAPVKGNGIDQVQDRSVHDWPHRLRMVERERRIRATTMHENSGLQLRPRYSAIVVYVLAVAALTHGREKREIIA